MPAAHMPMLFLANDRRAITAGYWFFAGALPGLPYLTGAVDLRRLDWHRGAAVDGAHSVAVLPILPPECAVRRDSFACPTRA